MNEVPRRASFLITSSLPSCWAANTRPSGSVAMAVGLVRPEATSVSTKPVGTVAAWRVVSTDPPGDVGGGVPPHENVPATRAEQTSVRILILTDLPKAG